MVDQIRFFAGAARVLEGRATAEYLSGHTSWIRREPVGVVGQVAPWNYPMMMAVWKFAPALAAGNTIVLKPSDTTPVSTALLAEIAQEALPPDAYILLARVIGEIRGQPREGLLSASILLALWAASTGMRSVMNALNIAYDVEESRPAWKRYPLSILYTIGLVVVVIAAAAFRLIGPWAAQRFANQLGLTTAVAMVWTWLRWPVVVVLLLLMVALIYYLGPNIDQPFRYVTPGSVSAVVVWILASLGFSAYVENFGNYGATYGSLGGMIVLLLYFFVSAAVLLFGAENKGQQASFEFGALPPGTRVIVEGPYGRLTRASRRRPRAVLPAQVHRHRVRTLLRAHQERRLTVSQRSTEDLQKRSTPLRSLQPLR